LPVQKVFLFLYLFLQFFLKKPEMLTKLDKETRFFEKPGFLGLGPP